MSKLCPHCDAAAGDRPVRCRASSNDFVAYDSEKLRHKEHVVVVPRKHFASINDMTRNEFADLIAYARRVAHDIGLTSFRMIVNVGEASGQRVKHASVEVFSDVGVIG